MPVISHKMMVACHNASGEPDIYFCKIRCTYEEYCEGEHYALAEWKAEDAGYEGPFVSICDDDSAGRAIVGHFAWETASEYTV